MKPEKRNIRKAAAGRSPGSARDVDPDQPFPQDPNAQDPGDADDRDLDQAFEGKKHGEGDYRAAKDYDKRVRSFVRSGQVERASEQAQPRDRDEALELAEAEEKGRSRSKGEDPSTRGGGQKKHR